VSTKKRQFQLFLYVVVPLSGFDKELFLVLSTGKPFIAVFYATHNDSLSSGCDIERLLFLGNIVA
jgi:hypothetical protein